MADARQEHPMDPSSLATTEPAAGSAASASRAFHRHAIAAATWGLPLVSVDAMRQAFLRDAGAMYGDILYLSQPVTWRFQAATPAASSHYVYFHFNLKSGPVVVDVPHVVYGAELSGTLFDAWGAPLTDVGSAAEDKRRAGPFVLLPPGDTRVVPGCVCIRSRTYNGYGWLRATPATPSLADLKRAIAIVKAMRVYPLAYALRSSAQRHIDIAGILFDGIVRFDDGFYDSLARMVNEEPLQPRDLPAMSDMRSIGIEKGRTFRPDQRTREALKEAITEVHAHLMRAMTAGGTYWPGSRWILSTIMGSRIGLSYETADEPDVDERDVTFFLEYGVPRQFTAGALHTGAYHDADDEPLQGGRSYRLRIPPSVPATERWTVTAYDLATTAFIRDAPRLAIDSHDRGVRKNDDGSIDVHFGPSAPAGQDANWIYTEPGKPWFSFFRFDGPAAPLLDKTWVLPSIERRG